MHVSKGKKPAECPRISTTWHDTDRHVESKGQSIPSAVVYMRIDPPQAHMLECLVPS